MEQKLKKNMIVFGMKIDKENRKENISDRINK